MRTRFGNNGGMKFVLLACFSFVLAAILCTSCFQLPKEVSSRAYAVSSDTPGAATLEANIFVKPAKKVLPSVVNISTLTAINSSMGRGGQEDLRRFFEDFFRQFGGRGFGGQTDEDEETPPSKPAPGGPGKGGPKAMALGTGFIIDSTGLILTNNHVVAGADEIKIQFTEEANEKSTDGEVVGRDPELDLALIKVKSKRQMVPVVLGDSDALEVGEYVFAVGNPFGQGHTVTHGVISAKVRSLPGFALANHLQTDAPINPGNSGGPLCNLKGEVIGINNAIDQRAQGIGFAIPINLAKKVLTQLKQKGTVARGYIGVQIIDLSSEIAVKLGLPKDLQAPLVADVYPGEPADKAGIKPYDVITEFNGKPVHTPAELIGEVTAMSVGETATLKVNRSSTVKEFKIQIAQRPGFGTSAETETKPKKKSKGPTHAETGMEIEEINKKLAKELNLPEKLTGVIVTQIQYGGKADKAGLMRGDVIVEVDQKLIKDPESFYSVVKDKKSYLLRVRRADPQGREGYSVIILDLKKE